MKNVLVPFDGSACALRALTHAIAELRGRAGVTLHLLNVQTPPVHVFPDKLVSPDMLDHELLRTGAEALEQARTLVQAAGLECAQHVRIGRPADEIAACANECHCDAIVMGTRGMGAVTGLVLGSAATKVVHVATVPVTLVK
jgi:nucleotide-binding universal stress UspA family protein